MQKDQGESKTPLPWFRMYHEFSTDPKVQMLSEVDQRRFVMLLCLRCCNGSVTLQDDAVTFQLRISSDEWASTKSRLVDKGLIGEDNQPTNWGKRQKKADRSNERVSRHREKAKRDTQQDCNVTVTAQSKIKSKTEIEEKPPNPLPGGTGMTFADPHCSDGIVEHENGSLELVNGTRAFWLERFGGDERRLEFALIEAAGQRQPNTRQPLRKQIERTLARIAGQKHDSDQRYQSAVKSRPAGGGAVPIKIKPVETAAERAKNREMALAADAQVEAALRAIREMH